VKIDRRPPDFDHRVEDHRLGAALAIMRLGQTPEHVLQDNHRAVDDDPEIHRAERQQVGRDPADAQADEGREQRQRDDDRDDAGGAQAAEEQEQHDGHEQRALQQVTEHRVERGVDQRRPVVERDDADRLGQD
jgi:hypothetical protein